MAETNELRDLITMIHHVNNLWHLCMACDSPTLSQFYLEYKNFLQIELLKTYDKKTEIIEDPNATLPNGDACGIIKIRGSKLDGCHIPLRLVQNLEKQH